MFLPYKENAIIKKEKILNYTINGNFGKVLILTFTTLFSNSIPKNKKICLTN